MARADDVSAIKSIAVNTGLFESEEVVMFDSMIAGYLDGRLDDDVWLVLEGEGGTVVAAAYYAPEPFSDRVWNLYFLGVDPNRQGRGAGASLVSTVEDALRAKGEEAARVLIVETSGVPGFEPTRQFYRGLGFDEEACIREFYGPGDDKIVYWKSLVAA